ncbi:hypothetical protein B0H10DRAFT_815016 [Mycena sp. CBHHK59/15]|nr:hypothetical protein B0H10DRAFT_815016 [Mycena sp. CBHHK59/15]
MQHPSCEFPNRVPVSPDARSSRAENLLPPTSRLPQTRRPSCHLRPSLNSFLPILRRSSTQTRRWCRWLQPASSAALQRASAGSSAARTPDTAPGTLPATLSSHH